MASGRTWPKVAIIILNWNGFQDTAECLESLKKSDYPAYKVVLVDNASANDEGNRLKEIFPEVQLIQNLQNRGFAGGNNDGMHWAVNSGYEYVVNLNNDCVVDANWLSELINGLKSTGSDFGASRIVFYGEKEIIASDGEAVLLGGSVVSLNQGKNRFSPRLDTRRKLYYACGAASVYSAQCLKEVKIKEDQFFDESFFIYYEDADLGARLNMKNYTGTSVPGSVVYHKVSRAMVLGSEFQRFQLEKNRLLYKIFNYPLYLIVLGEAAYLFSRFYNFIFSIFRKGGKASAEAGSPGWFRIFIRARMWMIANRKDVLLDRSERKKRGFIKKRIFRYLFWDFPEHRA